MVDGMAASILAACLDGVDLGDEEVVNAGRSDSSPEDEEGKGKEAVVGGKAQPVVGSSDKEDVNRSGVVDRNICGSSDSGDTSNSAAPLRASHHLAPGFSGIAASDFASDSDFAASGNSEDQEIAEEKMPPIITLLYPNHGYKWL